MSSFLHVGQVGNLRPIVNRPPDGGKTANSCSRSTFFLSALLLLATTTAIAQSSISGPSLGVIYDAADQAIRPVWGIPGSSTVGKRIDTGFAITAAAISPAQDYALVVSADGSLKLLVFTPSGFSTQDVNSGATPDRIVLSPAGSAAILYYQNTASAQVVSGLPGSMRIGPRIDISALARVPDVFAISDDAAVVLAGVAENEKHAPIRRSQPNRSVPAGGNLFLIPQDGNAPRSIRRVRHASALAFFKKSHDVAIADDFASSVTVVSDAGGVTGAVWTFTDPSLQAPDSVQVSPDNKGILAGSSQNQVLAMMDSTGANAVFVSCACAPTVVRPLSVVSIYQVTEARSGLLWILDTNPPNPRVLFVPVPSDSDPAAAENDPQ
jgi:hypothetical protein